MAVRQLGVAGRVGRSGTRRRSRPWTIGEVDWFTDVERLRSLFGQLVGADAEGVALVPATSYGFAVAAASLALNAQDHVLVLADEFPSGVYTWRRVAERTGASVRTVSREAGQSWTEAVLAAIDERVGIVSVPNVHWSDGGLVELDRVAARTRAVGARLVVDASQSLGVMPLDVATLRPDFVVSVGYKWLLGPFGRGYLWAAAEHRAGRPLEENWIVRADSQDFAPWSTTATSICSAPGGRTRARGRCSRSPRWPWLRWNRSSPGGRRASPPPSPRSQLASPPAPRPRVWASPPPSRVARTCSGCACPETPPTGSPPHCDRPTVSWPVAATRFGCRRTCTSPPPTSTVSSRHWPPAFDRTSLIEPTFRTSQD